MQSTWNIKRISSEWPSSGDFEGALQSDASVPGVSEVLWKYSNDTVGWKYDTAYKYHIKHRPSQDLIHVKLWENGSLLLDTGDVFDNATGASLKGGKLGVFCMSQENITWSALSYRCG
jgi:syndecan 4